MKSSRNVFLVLALTACFLFIVTACGGGGGGGDGTSSGPQEYTVSSSSGGSLEFTSAGTAVSLSFPAGAVSTDTMITVDSSASVYDSNILPGLGFQFLPEGLEFDEPVTIVVTYDDADLGGADESELKIHRWADPDWQRLPSTVDTAANTVTATLTGFSEYFLFPAMRKLYFPADDGIAGWVLWSWDGSGVTLHTDVNPQDAAISPGLLTEFKDKLYFVMYFDQLWSYDGSVAAPVGTYPVTKVGGAGGSNPPGLLPFGDKLYFTAFDSNGWHLWSYNQEAGMTTEEYGTQTTLMPQGYTVHDGDIYFEGSGDGNGTNNRELYVYDGVSAPQMVAEINSVGSSDPDWMTSFNGKLYFAADDGIHGRELWAYSSTDGAYLVKDIFPGDQNDDGISIPGGIATEGANKFTPYDGKLYFKASSSSNEIDHLWVTDGTAQGTTLVSDFTTCLYCYDAMVDNLTVLDNKLYFYGRGNYESSEQWLGMWVYDTSDETTPRPIPGAFQGQYALQAFGGELIFRGWDPGGGGYAGIVSSDGINEPVMEHYFSTNNISSQYIGLGDSEVY